MHIYRVICPVKKMEIVVRGVQHALGHGNAEYDNSLRVLAGVGWVMLLRCILKAVRGRKPDSSHMTLEVIYY